MTMVAGAGLEEVARTAAAQMKLELSAHAGIVCAFKLVAELPLPAGVGQPGQTVRAVAFLQEQVERPRSWCLHWEEVGALASEYPVFGSLGDAAVWTAMHGVRPSADETQLSAGLAVQGRWVNTRYQRYHEAQATLPLIGGHEVRLVSRSDAAELTARSWRADVRVFPRAFQPLHRIHGVLAPQFASLAGAVAWASRYAR